MEEGKTVRVVVPVVDEKDMQALLSEHFGRAPFFAAVDIDEKGEVVGLKMIPNVSEHFGGSGHPPGRILQLDPNAVVTYGMGPRALRIFQNARVAVLRTSANTVREVIDAYNRDELVELTEGCHHARHK
jgi:predicted Fe-Mo cluster-binding NifX family protein